MRPSRPRGFSLIELLVVLAIITLLVALLLPVLSHARFMAVQVQCQSRMRQGYMALMTYAMDAEQALPPSGVHDLPSFLNKSGTNAAGTHPQNADLSGLVPEYADVDVWMDPGFEGTERFKSWGNYRFKWYNQRDHNDWDAGGAGRRWLGYYYVKPSHIIWEQRYSNYGHMQSLRLDDSYPCGHIPDATMTNSIILLSCLNAQKNWLSPYGKPLDFYPPQKWGSIAHDPGRPRGSNLTWGDGAVMFAPREMLEYRYNGWIALDWKRAMTLR